MIFNHFFIKVSKNIILNIYTPILERYLCHMFSFWPHKYKIQIKKKNELFNSIHKLNSAI